MSVRAPVVRRVAAVLGREDDENRFHRRHANCSHRMPEHRPPDEAQILLGKLSGETPAASRGGNERER